MQTNLGVFKGEVIIIRDFVARSDVNLGINDDLLLSTDGDDFRRAIRVARVVDEPAVRADSHQDAFNVDEHYTHPRFPILVASTTRSSSILNR